MEILQKVVWSKMSQKTDRKKSDFFPLLIGIKIFSIFRKKTRFFFKTQLFFPKTVFLTRLYGIYVGIIVRFLKKVGRFLHKTRLEQSLKVLFLPLFLSTSDFGLLIFIF